MVCSLCPMRRVWPKCRDRNRRRRDTGALHGPLGCGEEPGSRAEGRGKRLQHALAHTMPLITHLLGDDIALIICELLLSDLLSREMKDFVSLQ